MQDSARQIEDWLNGERTAFGEAEGGVAEQSSIISPPAVLSCLNSIPQTCGGGLPTKDCHKVSPAGRAQQGIKGWGAPGWRLGVVLHATVRPPDWR